MDGMGGFNSQHMLNFCLAEKGSKVFLTPHNSPGEEEVPEIAAATNSARDSTNSKTYLLLVRRFYQSHVVERPFWPPKGGSRVRYSLEFTLVLFERTRALENSKNVKVCSLDTPTSTWRGEGRGPGEYVTESARSNEPGNIEFVG